MLQNACNAEIANFNGSILIHKNVLCLQVSMQDLPIVDVLNRESHLDEPVENLVLAVAYFTYLFLICYFRIQIAAIGVIHYNAETALIHKRFFVGDNIGMTHSLEDMHFIDGIFALLPVHLAHVNNFHYIRLPVSH